MVSNSNNLPNNRSCPLCDKPANVKSVPELVDFNTVLCERCGYFQLANGALIGYEQSRHLLAGLTRRASTPEPRVASRLDLTRDSVPSLLANSGVPKDLIDQMDLTLEYSS